ncbi:hypothetical protein TREMEDRAFT_62653 [Tremella mesenterica DSM 1558]|uniref:uncharacterized protein n=1 Tax=Tremella mesenterica (strain ATCC 24925 / CBS 8224 / DSM 1558 / NBRC 9311 / NRRL Y-6157 / RJB 2259-6 / UBC 559-6) TaxID=578456 RepID=UPI0003F4A4B6|nr:uncharacterized protein TREMEDRAFT_62653 [Tremella mesenterica DSM 1558]EIW68937.1 hypothetical protein TREMEDRAFT_62653 [Tremella mesenterica DSM 1558]
MGLSDTGKIILPVLVPIGTFFLIISLALLYRRKYPVHGRQGRFSRGIWYPPKNSSTGQKTYTNSIPLFELPPLPSSWNTHEEHTCPTCGTKTQHAAAQEQQQSWRRETDITSSDTTLVQPTFSKQSVNIRRISAVPEQDQNKRLLSIASSLAASSSESITLRAASSSDALARSSFDSMSTLTPGNLHPRISSLSTGVGILGYPLRKFSKAHEELEYTGKKVASDVEDFNPGEEERLRGMVDMGERRPSLLSSIGSLTIRRISAGGSEDLVSIKNGLFPSNTQIPPSLPRHQAEAGPSRLRSASLPESSKTDTPMSLMTPGNRDSMSPGQVGLAQRISFTHVRADVRYPKAVSVPAITVHSPADESRFSGMTFGSRNPFAPGINMGDKRSSIMLEEGVKIRPSSGEVHTPSKSVVMAQVGNLQEKDVARTPIPKEKVWLSSSSALARMSIGAATAVTAALATSSHHTHTPVDNTPLSDPSQPRNDPGQKTNVKSKELMPIKSKSKFRPDSLLLLKRRPKKSASMDQAFQPPLPQRYSSEPDIPSLAWTEPLALHGVAEDQLFTAASVRGMKSPSAHSPFRPFHILKRRHTTADLTSLGEFPEITRSPLPQIPRSSSLGVPSESTVIMRDVGGNNVKNDKGSKEKVSKPEHGREKSKDKEKKKKDEDKDRKGSSSKEGDKEKRTKSNKETKDKDRKHSKSKDKTTEGEHENQEKKNNHTDKKGKENKEKTHKKTKDKHRDSIQLYQSQSEPTSPIDIGIFEGWQGFAPSRPVLPNKRRPSALSLHSTNTQASKSAPDKGRGKITYLADLTHTNVPTVNKMNNGVIDDTISPKTPIVRGGERRGKRK